MNRIASAAARAFILVVSSVAAMSCTGGNISGQAAESHELARSRAFRISHSFESRAEAYRLDIHAVGLEEILLFQVEEFEAVDQSGNACELNAAGVQWMKGGTEMFLDIKADSKATTITVTARLRLNDDVVDVVAGLRRRTQAERNALNRDVLWQSLDEMDQVTISGARHRCSGRPPTGK